MTDPVRPVAPREASAFMERVIERAKRECLFSEKADYFVATIRRVWTEELAAAPVPCAASPADRALSIHESVMLLKAAIDEADTPYGQHPFLFDTLSLHDAKRILRAWADAGLVDGPRGYVLPERVTGEGARDEEARDSDALGMRPVSERRQSADAGGCGRMDGDSVGRGGSSPHSEDVPQSDVETARAPDAAAASQADAPPVAVALDPHRRLVADLLDPVLAQVDDCALWKVLNEADEHKTSWSVDAWRQWFVRLVDAASELSCRLEDPDFLARLRGAAAVRVEQE